MRAAIRNVAFIQITCATVLGLAATDLVLPAIPILPQALGGTAAQAQFVLAVFVAGFAAGLLIFGELGARRAQRSLLAGGLALFAGCSVLAATASSIEELIAWRALQGFAVAAGPALAPGVIRAIFDERQAVRAFGLQGSIEAIVPAVGPIVGAWLLVHYPWQASFVLLAVLALVVSALALLMPDAAFMAPAARSRGGYRLLLRNRAFLCFGLSQAFTLGGLLVLVFGAPAVMVRALGGTLPDFILMQVLGVGSFIIAANMAGTLVARFGAVRMIMAGSIMSAAGCCALLAYAAANGRSPLGMALLFVPVNLGLGLRGPPGFYQAIAAAGGDDSRAAALVVLAVLLTTAAGTALAAPWVTSGLLPLSAIAAGISLASVLTLRLRPRT
ncbi:MAG TPA: MFS transporter [Ramlibacter sp.]|nr:MFS transporter [Ramlibacter sp.]